uniref:Uncharacterized protein n=1 Tax=Anguilla anguilla TaxID=7936 RepID=A0A0E9V2W1_ANGAN
MYLEDRTVSLTIFFLSVWISFFHIR